jgi:hypothetical protein
MTRTSDKVASHFSLRHPPQAKASAADLIKYALKFRRTFFVLAILIVFLGAGAIATMPKDVFPIVDVPGVTIISTCKSSLIHPPNLEDGNTVRVAEGSDNKHTGVGM